MHYDHMIGDFDSFYSPTAVESIRSIISENSIDTSNRDLLYILSNDKLFTGGLKMYKNIFDTEYKRITLYPNFLF